MNSSELRAKARESLQGKWGKAAIITVLFMLITAIFSMISNSESDSIILQILALAFAIISPVITFGYIVSLMRVSRNEDVSATEFAYCGFSSFGKIWAVALRTLVKMLIPVIIMIVGIVMLSASLFSSMALLASDSTASVDTSSGLALVGILLFIVGFVYSIIKGLLYTLTNMILYDEPNLSAKEIVEKSASLMLGNRWKLFCLQLSFLGWVILGALSCGIGMIWVTPYMQTALIKFYENLAGSSSVTTAEPEAIHTSQE